LGWVIAKYFEILKKERKEGGREKSIL